MRFWGQTEIANRIGFMPLAQRHLSLVREAVKDIDYAHHQAVLPSVSPSVLDVLQRLKSMAFWQGDRNSIESSRRNNTIFQKRFCRFQF